MRARSALGAFQIIAIGVVSTAAVFALHRAFLSDPALSLASGRPASSLESSVRSDDPRASLAEPAARSELELLAKAEPAGDESGSETTAEERAPAPGSRDVPNPHVAALRSPSPTYRNVSLTTVIREAGYVCIDILSSAAGDDGLGTWRVSCEDARAYLISEDGAGGLRVEPIAYFEVPVRQPLEMIHEPLNTPPRLLPAPR